MAVGRFEGQKGAEAEPQGCRRKDGTEAGASTRQKLLVEGMTCEAIHVLPPKIYSRRTVDETITPGGNEAPGARLATLIRCRVSPQGSTRAAVRSYTPTMSYTSGLSSGNILARDSALRVASPRANFSISMHSRRDQGSK